MNTSGSIAQKSRHNQAENPTRPAVRSISVYASGVRVKGYKFQLVGNSHPYDVPRGKITGFSPHAAARMRDFFLRFDVPDTEKFAVTLTLPGNGFDCSLDIFKRCVNAAFTAWKYKAKNAGMVYRVEMQCKNRVAPHVHATVYGRSGDDSALVACWIRYIVTHFGGFDVQDFVNHGVRCDKCPTDSVGWYRYCIDHATKHKAEQLGYQGKQWGIVHRELFKVNPSLASVDLSLEPEPVVWWFVRYFQRLNRYPVTIKTPDGRRVVVKYRRNRRLFGVSFLRGGGAMALRLLQMARYTAKNAPTKAR